MKKLIILILTPFICHSNQLEEVIFSSDKYETNYKNVTSSVSKISSDQIKLNKSAPIYRILETSPGVMIQNSGGHGSLTTMRIRGGESSHTLFMFEGIKLNDPLTTSGVYDLGGLSNFNISTIEILKGSNSVLYGPSAMGGVVNIKMRDDNTKEITYGYDTLKSHSIFAYHGDKKNKISLEIKKSEGYNKTKLTHENFEEKDGYQKVNMTFKNHSKNNFGKNKFITTFTHSNIELDKTSSFEIHGDDPNYQTRKNSLLLANIFEIRPNSSKKNKKISASLNISNRKTTDGKDEITSEKERYSFNSHIFNLSYQEDWFLFEHMSNSFGLDYFSSKGELDSLSVYGNDKFESKTENIMSLYNNNKFDYKDFYLDLGIRAENNNQYDSKLNYKIGLSHVYNDQIKNRTSFSTGHRSPSLYERYSIYGSRDLSSESSKNYELGSEYFNESFSLGINLYKTSYNNLIIFDSTNSNYKNSNKAIIYGQEYYLNLSLDEDIFFKINYTKLNTFNYLTRRRLTFRPDKTLSSSLMYKSKKWTYLTSFYYRGGVDNSDYSNEVLLGHQRYDALIEREISENQKVQFRVENIFNKKYELGTNINNPGRVFFVNYSITLL